MIRRRGARFAQLPRTADANMPRVAPCRVEATQAGRTRAITYAGAAATDVVSAEKIVLKMRADAPRCVYTMPGRVCIACARACVCVCVCVCVCGGGVDSTTASLQCVWRAMPTHVAHSCALVLTVPCVPTTMRTMICIHPPDPTRVPSLRRAYAKKPSAAAVLTGTPAMHAPSVVAVTVVGDDFNPKPPQEW